MPLIKESSYRPSFLFRSKHLNTMFPSVFRKIKGLTLVRERIETPDNDFLDVDWSKVGGNQLVIVLHGLEGSADRPYVGGIMKAMNLNGWDGVGINFRGCSGSRNRQARSYHSGETTDLDLVVQRAVASGQYQQIALVGFSLGGNVVFKYIGERGKQLNSLISHAVGFSVPCHLESCSYELSKWYNKIYLNRFLVALKEKAVEKKHLLKDRIDFEQMAKASDFFEFDDLVTGPVHGFKGAKDYWTKSSSKQFLSNIAIPSLMINAFDDTFLSEKCYPKELAKASNHFHLEIPRYGGHVGFHGPDKDGLYWSDRRVAEFILAT